MPGMLHSASAPDQSAVSPANGPTSPLGRPLTHLSSAPIMIREFDTTTSSHSDFAYLWSFIPNRFADFQPERIYSSNIHGRRLRTLYDHVEYHEYCFIMIRNEQQHVFGAFCAGQLANRTKGRSWFGTGESFLFTLKPERQVHKWVGSLPGTRGPTKAHEDFFIYADDERLQIGGSADALNIGLLIQQDLNQGSTRGCDTFASLPLSTIENFQIMEIEAFGFTR